jgi:SpoVK/Ycf46/Vps4 family AAA+-type ATPase
MCQAVWNRDLLDKQKTDKKDKLEDNEEYEDDENNKSKVTLSAILNAIDGIRNNHGMILVMTTNHPERLDDALIRDGRVDERLLFDYCTHNQIYTIFKNFYNGDLKLTLEDFEKLELDERKLAPCNVEVALKKFYKDQNQAYEFLVNYNPTKHKEEFYDHKKISRNNTKPPIKNNTKPSMQIGDMVFSKQNNDLVVVD